MTSFKRVHVRELMQTDVQTLRDADTLEQAVSVFAEYHISGAPVVDATGRLVGVLSAFDVASTGILSDSSKDRGDSFWSRATEESFEDEESFDFSEAPGGRASETVADWMSREVVTVEPGASLQLAALQMAKHSVHRVPVVDPKEGLVGILSTFDIVRYIADHPGS